MNINFHSKAIGLALAKKYLTLFVVLITCIHITNAEDLISRVTNDLPFLSTYEPTISYQNFTSDPFDNFQQFNLFDISTDFPVNIDAYFESGSQHVKLKLNQGSFNSIKQSEPDHLELTIPVNNQKSFMVLLKRTNPLSEDFEFSTVNGNTIPYNEGLHYQGIIEGNQTSWVSLSIFEGYVRGLFVDFEGIYVLSPIRNFNGDYLLYNDKQLAVPYYSDLSCGEIPGAAKTNDHKNQLLGCATDHFSEIHNLDGNVTKNKYGKNFKKSNEEAIKIAIECDYKMYQNHNNNFQEVYNYVTATLNEAAVLFANELINIQLSEIVAWDIVDSYDKNTSHYALDQFGARRKNDFNGDLLHLFTSEKRDKGGMAYQNGLGQCYTFYPDLGINYGPYALSVLDFWSCNFSVYHYDVWTFVHELGHNFGSRHTHSSLWEVNGVANQSLDNSYISDTALYCDDPLSGESCYDVEVTENILLQSGGTIMSYFLATSIGASFYRGFGEQPGDLIRTNIEEFLNKGCTNPDACYYDPTATIEDGSCIIGNAPNDISIFDDYPWLSSKIDKGSCGNESINVFTNTEFSNVRILINNNGCTDAYNCIGELLFSEDLSSYEISRSWTCRDCNGNIRGCTNASACNYNPLATISDDTCYFGDATCADSCLENCNCFSLDEVDNTSQDVFIRYPWLANAVNYTGLCHFEKITEYDWNSLFFIEIKFKDKTRQLFRNDGVLYCGINQCNDCIDELIPNGVITTCWQCDNGILNNTDVYPGDLNHDGIVNYVDVGLIGLYKTEIGPPRAEGYQNTDWYAHPAQDWGTQQLNNEDIKHFDCNGDGFIDDSDHQAVTKNMDMTWTTPMPPPPSPDESDYRVLLNPIEQISDDYIVLNVALQRRTGGDLTLQGGFFTIDYSDIPGNINYVVLGLFEDCWLGNRFYNLRYEINELPAERKIEVGFTKTDNMNSVGNGVIGDLILSIDNSAARLAESYDNIYQFQVSNIGVHNSIELTPLEDQVLQVNVGSNNCPSNLTLTEDTPFQNVYQSSNLIETNGFLIIEEDQEIEYKANRVSLGSGFRVKAGACFKAGYGSCD